MGDSSHLLHVSLRLSNRPSEISFLHMLCVELRFELEILFALTSTSRESESDRRATHIDEYRSRIPLHPPCSLRLADVRSLTLYAAGLLCLSPVGTVCEEGHARGGLSLVDSRWSQVQVRVAHRLVEASLVQLRVVD